MTWISLPICDMCKQEGRFSVAVIEYEGETKKYNSCKKHLKDVKGAGLMYWSLEKTTLSEYLWDKEDSTFSN